VSIPCPVFSASLHQNKEVVYSNITRIGTFVIDGCSPSINQYALVFPLLSSVSFISRYSPARWIWPKLGSFDRLSTEVLRKICHSPILREPFTTSPSHTVIGNQAPNCQLCSKAHTASTVPLVLHRTRMRDEKIRYQLPIVV
jgi:hypothetical protein